jgi:sporulation protein YlmC with PRC-barrel domain
VKDRDLIGRSAYLAGRFFGKVKDFYLEKKGGRIKGIIVARGFFRSKPVRRGLVSFDGERCVLSPEVAASTWKPSQRDTMKYSRVRYKEVFAGRGWKIGRLETLHLDPDEWSVTGLDVYVEHPLVLRDVGVYAELNEGKSAYGLGQFYKDAYSMKPGKIVEQMLDSDKARFLTDSGDSSIRGMGEASTLVSLPSRGTVILDAGNVVLPVDPSEVQRIVIDMVNRGSLRTARGRKDIVRDAFKEYYLRRTKRGTH